MSKSAIELAKRFLASDQGGLEDFRTHQFQDDEESHDDGAIDRLYAEFTSEFERVRSELSACFGQPLRTGTDQDEVIPLSGVFLFAVWKVEGRWLYAAVAHEDRECPILLMLGATSP